MKAFLFLASFVSFSVFAVTADELLHASDLGRGGVVDGITWDIKIKTTEDGDTSERNFIVKAKGNNALVEATLPARNKGEVYLFNDRVMWFYKPGLKKAVAISSRQRLTGQTANGDIASTHYARDYVPTVEKSETINGKKTTVLMLKAKDTNVTYDKIRYWVEDDRKVAVKAEFLTLEGKPFKQAEFEYSNTLSVNGKNIPFVSKMTIADAKFKDNKSVIEYASPKITKNNDSMFNVNSLGK